MGFGIGPGAEDASSIPLMERRHRCREIPMNPRKRSENSGTTSPSLRADTRLLTATEVCDVRLDTIIQHVSFAVFICSEEDDCAGE